MVEYQFQFYRPDGRRPAFTFAECRNDTEARRRAVRELAEHTTCHGVEIYRGPDLVGRLELDATSARQSSRASESFGGAACQTQG
jgi:hypothetical protein